MGSTLVWGEDARRVGGGRARRVTDAIIDTKKTQAQKKELRKWRNPFF